MKKCKQCKKTLLTENFKFPYLYRQAVFCNKTCESLYRKENWPGNKWRTGWTNSLKWVKKDEKYKEQCRKRATWVKQSEETIRKRVEKNRWKKRTPEQLLRMSESQKWEKWHNWLWWKSGEPYWTWWTETLKRSIRERDRYVCKLCLLPQWDVAHDVHHIDYDKQNCDPKNLITLCKSCHAKTNHNRNKWKKFFEDCVFDLLEM